MLHKIPDKADEITEDDITQLLNYQKFILWLKVCTKVDDPIYMQIYL